MANHTGNITTETWALADSPHHLTGHVTLTSGTLTIEAGCDVIFDGYYYLMATAGTLVSNGTLTSQIDFYSNLANPLRNSAYGVVIGGNYSHNVTYCNSKHCDYTFHLNDLAGTTAIISNLLIEDCSRAFYLAGTWASGASWKISNCKIKRYYLGIYGTTGANSTTLEFELCEFQYGSQGVYITSGSGTLILDRCLFQHTFDGFSLTYVTQANDCVFNNIWYICLPTKTTSTFLDCILTNNLRTQANYGMLFFASSGDATITTCDFINSVTYAVYAGGGLVNCYIAGCAANTATAGPTSDNVDTTADAGTDDGVMNTSSSETAPQFANVDYVSGLKSTPNQPKTISAEASTPGDTTCDITFTSVRRGRTVVKYGIVSGTLNIQASNDETWSGYDDSSVFVTAHSITLQGLTKGTTYYYKCYNEDALGEWSVSSAELSFTTTGEETRITAMSVEGNNARYEPNATATISGSVTLDNDTTATDVLLEVRRNSDDSLVSTLLSTTYNFTATTEATLTTINGSVITYNVGSTVADYYFKLTVSGGTPAIVGLTITTSAFAVADISFPTPTAPTLDYKGDTTNIISDWDTEVILKRDTESINNRGEITHSWDTVTTAMVEIQPISERQQGIMMELGQKEIYSHIIYGYYNTSGVVLSPAIGDRFYDADDKIYEIKYLKEYENSHFEIYCTFVQGKI